MPIQNRTDLAALRINVKEAKDVIKQQRADAATTPEQKVALDGFDAAIVAADVNGDGLVTGSSDEARIALAQLINTPGGLKAASRVFDQLQLAGAVDQLRAELSRADFDASFGNSFIPLQLAEQTLQDQPELLAAIRENAVDGQVPPQNMPRLFDALRPRGAAGDSLALRQGNTVDGTLAGRLEALASVAVRQVKFDKQTMGAERINDVMRVDTKVPLPDGSTMTLSAHPSMPTDAAGKIIDLPVVPLGASGPFDHPELAKLIAPGEVAFVAASYYALAPGGDGFINSATTGHANEAPKDYVGHAGVAVGVEGPNGQRGVVVIETPANYGALQRTGYGVRGISKIVWPEGITPEQQAAYQKNIATSAMLLSKFVPFAANNINGGDPLGMNDYAKVEQSGLMLVRATAGDRTAIDWLKAADNTMYCAELINGAVNTGVNFIYDAPTLRRAGEAWANELNDDAAAARHLLSQGKDVGPNPTRRAIVDAFVALTTERLNSGAGVAGSAIKGAELVQTGTADPAANLRPLKELVTVAPGEQELVVKYETFADLVFRYLKRHFPRQSLDGLAEPALSQARQFNLVVGQVQAHAFGEAATRFEGLAAAGGQTLPPEWQQFKAGVVEMLTKGFATEAERTAATQRLLTMGQQFTPVTENGTGMFVHPASWLGNTVRDNKGILPVELVSWGYPKALVGAQPPSVEELLWQQSAPQ